MSTTSPSANFPAIDSSARLFDFKRYLKTVPKEPGVYLMKGHSGEILYIGKAKSLRNRLQNYFSGSDTRPFVARLPQVLSEIDVLLTSTEKEALLLESHLIKKHQPRFNIMLKGGKAQLHLRVHLGGAWPRVQISKRRRRDGAHYFGPYTSASQLRETLDVLQRHFQLRTCRDAVLKNRTRPCLQHQIKRCPGPCVIAVPQEEYRASLEEALLFLKGHGSALRKQLEARMLVASEALAFEQAAQLRDQMQAVSKVLSRQKVVLPEPLDQDVFALHREDGQLTIQLLRVREGRLQGGETFHAPAGHPDDGEVLSQVLAQYYGGMTFTPEEILLSHALSAPEPMEEWLSEAKGGKVKLKVPVRGPRMQLIETAQKNAQHQHEQRRRGESQALGVLRALQTSLELRSLPRRIECFDISNLQEQAIVASMVVFIDGRESSSDYRTYKLSIDAQDDFASMDEVLARRYRKVAEGIEEPPDLIVVDGGKGQLSAALRSLEDLGIAERLEIVGLAKSRVLPGAAVGTVEHSIERVFKPGAIEPIALPQHSQEVLLLQRIRDEAHRTAVGFHRRVRQRISLRSRLDDAPGVGPKKKKALLLHFGSISRLLKANLEEICKVPGFSAKSTKKLMEYLGMEDDKAFD